MTDTEVAAETCPRCSHAVAEHHHLVGCGELLGKGNPCRCKLTPDGIARLCDAAELQAPVGRHIPATLPEDPGYPGLDEINEGRRR